MEGFQQTNQQTDNSKQNKRFSANFNSKTDFERANEILSSLDAIRKEIRLKFKQLTPQEMSVFSMLYSLEEKAILGGLEPEISYKTLASQLNLTESSIRDYINKLIFKGIPIEKVKKNNKSVLLSVSQELKKIASLSTINRLRDI